MFECTRITAKVYTDQSGIYYEMPVLLTADGHLDILLDYLIEHWDSRSPAWMVKVTIAVQLFLEYFTAQKSHVDEQRVFQSFRQRLITGTITSGYDDDTSGLWWSARGPKIANRIIRNLTDFFNWWSMKNPWKKNPAATWIPI